MNDEERKAWEDDVRWAMQPHTDVATLAVNYKTLRAADAELKRLREVLNVDHVALVNESFDLVGWDNLTPGEKSMVRMTLAELRRGAKEG